MTIHYTSQIQEHHHVRQNAGMFAVSHMGVLDVIGNEALAFLRHVLANDVAKLNETGRALYSCMLNPKSGVIDDLIVYYIALERYRIVLNAGRRQEDLAWLNEQMLKFDVQLNLRDDMAIVAVQGPDAINIVEKLMSFSSHEISALKPFRFIMHDDVQIARTGYTGEDGVEIVVSATKVVDLWEQLITAGVTPFGLGARDTLRLEAGMNLYGHDMTESTSPLISNLAWTVCFKDETRDFIGRAALEFEKNKGIHEKLIGVVMEEKGVLRDHQILFIDEQPIGEITSGSFSPTLGHAIALARINTQQTEGVYIDRRGKKIVVELVAPPFVRLGKKLVEKGKV
jgi:aminomethyltransferase